MFHSFRELVTREFKLFLQFVTISSSCILRTGWSPSYWQLFKSFFQCCRNFFTILCSDTLAAIMQLNLLAIEWTEKFLNY